MIQSAKNTNTERDMPDSTAGAATLEKQPLPLRQGFQPMVHAPWELTGSAPHLDDLVERRQRKTYHFEITAVEYDTSLTLFASVKTIKNSIARHALAKECSTHAASQV
jgi:hypothetical protein